MVGDTAIFYQDYCAALQYTRQISAQKKTGKAGYCVQSKGSISLSVLVEKGPKWLLEIAALSTTSSRLPQAAIATKPARRVNNKHSRFTFLVRQFTAVTHPAQQLHYRLTVASNCLFGARRPNLFHTHATKPLQSVHHISFVITASYHWQLYKSGTTLHDMERLPPELKQRICSYLHASPALLKPIRLISKDFACAAAPYLIPRIFLVKHKDSCAEVREIIEHPIFSKHVTTLVVDPNNLKNHKSFQKWVDEHDHLRQMYPDWWDFKPEDIEYDEDGDPLLDTSQARTKWAAAFRKYDQAVKKVSKTLEQSQEQYWKAQRQIAAYQSTEEFRHSFLDTIADSFKLCPKLVNFVVAPPVPGQDYIIKKLLSMFQSIHPFPGSWNDADSHDPFEIGLAELMSAANRHNIGLNSLTIIDLPFKVAGYSKIESPKSFESLKHIRIGYTQLGKSPKIGFGFNLEEVIHTSHSLETLWIDMPSVEEVPLEETFIGDAMLQAISSGALRDVLLNDFAVSEDALVSFLLRHSPSLQQLSLSVSLTTGTWTSVLRCVSCQMTALTNLHLSRIRLIDGPRSASLSGKWCREARNFVLDGGVLPEPYYSADEDEEDGHNDHIEPSDLACRDLPEVGLWKDYDIIVKVLWS